MVQSDLRTYIGVVKFIFFLNDGFESYLIRILKNSEEANLSFLFNMLSVC
jgi:hypothetical protein